MPDNQEKINALLEKLENLMKKQDDFKRETDQLRLEILRMKAEATAEKPAAVETKPSVNIPPKETVPPKEITPPREIIPVKEPMSETTGYFKHEDLVEKTDTQERVESTIPKTKPKSDLERFIGENLISKIGIIITVIGVSIGVKYAIDHQLISPLTRVILGYLFGIGMLGFAIRLRKGYENFSAVLLSGSMAILYFITFAAYNYFGLIPQMATFALMILFTVFTVIAAISYNKQVIAHIGMVGAYAVPFLLSSNSGQVAVLFSYVAIINIGILAIAIKKYWKPLYYFSFTLTWVIYLAWYIFDFIFKEHFVLAMTFVIVFFAIFYITFLAYKLIRKEKFGKGDVVSLLINSFIFYGVGYSILDSSEQTNQLLGIFTLANAALHFVAGTIIYKQKLADRNLFYLVSGLVLVFVTITIPVQLDGNWVSLLWVGEAALLFWIGRTRHVRFYERLSYVLMILAFGSILEDWQERAYYYLYIPIKNVEFTIPVFNISFLTSVLFIAAFAFINYVNSHPRYRIAGTAKNYLALFTSFILAAILLIVIYYTFRIEIESYLEYLYAKSQVTIQANGLGNNESHYNEDLLFFKQIWVINYSLLFVSLLAFFNLYKLRNKWLAFVNITLIGFALAAFLTQGLLAISDLRENYLDKELNPYFREGYFNIGIRYVSFLFAALVLYALYKYVQKGYLQGSLKFIFEFVLYVTILWILSSEFIHWMDMAGSTQSYKLGLSILWGVYSLFLIILGIRKRKKYLRMGAIILFGATLVKLFFYDISHLDTISKTVVFVSLGILLLIISFLYNKYKHIITDEESH